MLPHQNLSLADIPGENWVDIHSYEGSYQISSFGRIKSLGIKGTKGWKGSSRILHHRFNPKGYHSIVLYKNGKREQLWIARLVAEHFIPNPQSKPFVDHIDNNKDNNHISNLRWVTAHENMTNPISIARRICTWRKKCPPKSKGPDKRERPVIAINPITLAAKRYDTIKSTSADGFNPKLVSRVCLKGRKSTNGWMFFFINDPSLTSYLPRR